MSHFLRMGGYAFFVWPSYALTLAVIAWNIHSARRALDAARQAVRRRLAAQKGPGGRQESALAGARFER